MRQVFILAIIGLLTGFSLTAQQEQFQQANNAYNQSDYKLSIKLYQEILSGGYMSPDLYLNLGNAFLKNGELGEAILSYEKGLKINEDHQVLVQNLKYANKQIAIPVTPIPDFFLSRYWQNFLSSLGSSGWAAIQIILFVLIVIGVGMWLLGKELKIKKLAFYSLPILSIFLIISFIAGTQKYKAEQKSSHAIVVSDNSQLRSGASTQSELIIDISEGTKVKLLDSIDDFYKVQLMDKEIGWVLMNEIVAI